MSKVHSGMNISLAIDALDLPSGLDVDEVAAARKPWLEFYDEQLEREYGKALPKLHNVSSRRRMACALVFGLWIVANVIITVRVLAAEAVDHTVFVVQATDAFVVSLTIISTRLVYIVLYELDPDKYLSNAQQLSAIVFNAYSIGVTLFWACIWRVLHPPGVEVVRYQDLPSFNDALDGTLGVGAQVDSRQAAVQTLCLRQVWRMQACVYIVRGCVCVHSSRVRVCT